MSKQKPLGCTNCPLYGDGLGWVPDSLSNESEVLIISVFPTQYEATTGIPRSGMTVQQYEKDYESHAGPITTSYASVIRCRGQRGTKLPTGARLKAGVQFCRQYDRTPAGIRLVVFQGVDVARHLAPDVPNPEVWPGFLLQRDKGNDI